MNIQVFSNRFIKIYETIDSAGLSWDDEVSFFKVYSRLDSMAKKLQAASDVDKAAIFNSEAQQLMLDMEMYRQDLKELAEMDETHILRITEINRIDFLFDQQIKKVSEELDLLHFMIADRMIQGALVSGLNGKDHKLYLNELLNKKTLLQAVEYVSQSRPVLEKYGKRATKENKKQLSEMSFSEVLNVAKKLLGKDPIDLLEMYPGYMDIF